MIRRVVLALHVLLRVLEVLPLELHGIQPPAVGERDLDRAGEVARDLVQGAHGSLERQVRQEPVLDHLQHDRGRPDLQELRDLAHVRVADDHVQAPVLLRVGVRLVARVDDRPLQRGLEPHLGLEEVGALRELVDRPAALVPWGLGPELPCTAEDLPGDEERRQVADDVGEGGLPVDEVVLVGAVGVALAVRVVLVDHEAAASPAAGWRPPAASVRGSAPPPCRGSPGRAP